MPNTVLTAVPHDAYLLQYNGYAWDNTANTSIRSRSERDSSGRTIKYIRSTLTVTWKVFKTSPTTTDATMEALKQQLMSQGGALYYRDKGFGTFSINVPGGQKKDAAWGPVPTNFDAQPFADAYGWDCTWTVEVCIPWCDSAKFENVIAEWNYQWYSDKDDGGYETRRITGHVEIPMTRTNQGDRFIRATADDYREMITPRCPPFFRPTTSYFNLSEDRRTLIFNFAFEQFPGPIPPPGVLKVSMPESMTSDGAANFVSWQWNLSADYELVYGVPVAVAWGHFLRTVLQLRDIIRKEVVAAGKVAPEVKQNDGAAGPGEAGAGNLFLANIKEAVKAGVILGAGALGVGRRAKKPDQDIGITIFPYQFSSKNPDRYGKRKCSFSLTHRIAGIKATLLVAGMWEKLPGDNDWDRWYKAAGPAFGPRGITGSHFDPGDDVIIDPCRVANPSTLKGRKAPVRKELIAVPVATGELLNVDPNATWISLKMDLELVQHDSVLVHKPLPEDRTLRAGGGGGGFNSSLRTPAALSVMNKYIPPEDAGGTGIQYDSGNSTENISTIARQAANTYTVILRGTASRLGLKPDLYGLTSVGGIPAVAANNPDLGDGSRITTVANCGVPIFVAVWQFRYLLPWAPGTRSKDADSGSPIAAPAVPSTIGTSINQSPEKIAKTITGSVPTPLWGLRRF